MPSSPAHAPTLDFLNLVLPSEGNGYYAAFVLEGRNNFFTTDLGCLSDYIIRNDREQRTIYHACATFTVEGRRTQANAHAAASFWLDIDCGKGKDYADQGSAVAAVRAFCDKLALPTPTFVNSGSGVHLYWPVDVELDPGLWLRHAHGLRYLCRQEGLAVSSQERTCDLASVLRTPGTHWRKHGVREVKCAALCGPYPIETFEIFREHGHEEKQAPRYVNGSSRADRVLVSIANIYSAEPADADHIATACDQVGQLREKGGRLTEPLWHACLGVLAHCDDGDRYAHEWSAPDERYDFATTQGRLDRWRDDGFGPTTCERFHSLNPQVCEACPHWGKITSPIVLGRGQGGVSQQVLDPNALGQGEGSSGASLPFGSGRSPRAPSELLNQQIRLPEGYEFREDGALVLKTEDRSGGPVDHLLSSYRIHLSSVQTGEVKGEFNLVFRHNLPDRGWYSFGVPARSLFGPAGGSDMAEHGANIHDHAAFVRFARQSIDMLYRDQQIDTRFDQFGWKEDDTAFLYGLNLYARDGIHEVPGSDELQLRCRHDNVGPAKGGDLHAWQEAVNILFVKGCEPQAVSLIASFAAPLMRFIERDEGGAIVHVVTPESGKGKTTALLSAASVWGHKDGLSLTNDDTRIAKALTLGALGNLPVIHDQMTLKDPDAVTTFVSTFTEGRDKMRATRAGTLRHSEATWQTLLISASNMSLVDCLAGGRGDDPDALAWRVIELSMDLPRDIKTAQGEKWRKVIRVNSGHAGHVYLNWVVNNLDWVKQSLDKMVVDVWKQGFETRHRYWVRAVAAIYVAGTIVRALGLVEFSIDRIADWLLSELRGVALPGHGRSWSVAALAEFLNVHRGRNMLVVPGPFKPHVRTSPLREAQGDLMIRHEVEGNRYFVAQSALRDWLTPRQQSYKELVKALKREGVVKRPACLITLAAGTDSPGGQVYCLEIDGRHEQMQSVTRTDIT